MTKPPDREVDMTPNPDDAPARRPREQRDAAHRGRRQTDQVFDGWTWSRIQKIGGALIVLGTIYVAVTAFVATKLATRQEVDELKVEVDTLKISVRALRSQREADARAAAEDRQMLRALSKLRCREIDAETAALVDMPCATLGITPNGRRRP